MSICSLNASNKEQDENLYTDSKIFLRVLVEDDANKCAELISDNYCKNDKITKALSITEEEFNRYSSLISKSCAKSGLSIGAFDKITQEMVGCVLNQDLFHDQDLHSMDLSIKFKPIFSLIANVAASFKQENEVLPQHYVHLRSRTVKEQFTSKNYLSCMIHASLILARKKGYQRAIAECNGEASLISTLKLGAVAYPGDL